MGNKQALIIELKGKIEHLNKKLSESDRKLQQFQAQTKSRAATLTKFFTPIGGAIAAAFSVTALVRFGEQLGGLATQVQGVRTAFNNLTAAPAETLDSMKKATGGLINELELMQKASEAALLGLPLDRFDEMLSIARGAATATGKSMDFMLDSLVVALGRGSKMMLDNLGILIDTTASQKAYAESIDKTASALTDLEKKQAFIDAALKKGAENLEAMGGEASFVTDNVKVLRAELENLKTDLAEDVNPAIQKTAGFFATFLQSMAEARERAKKQRTNLASDLIGDPDDIEEIEAALVNAREQLDITGRRTDLLGHQRKAITRFINNDITALETMKTRILDLLEAEKLRTRNFEDQARLKAFEATEAGIADDTPSEFDLAFENDALLADIDAFTEEVHAKMIEAHEAEQEAVLATTESIQRIRNESAEAGLAIELERAEAAKLAQERRAAEFLETNQIILAGYDTLWASISDTEMSGAERTERVLKAMQRAALNQIAETLKAYIIAEVTKSTATTVTTGVVVANNAVQSTSNVVTAGTSALAAAMEAGRSVASIPFVGPVLALAAIGAILGAFNSAKSATGSSGGASFPSISRGGGAPTGAPSGAFPEVGVPAEPNTPVVLQGPRSFGRDGAGTVNIHVTTVDGDEFDRIVQDKIAPRLKDLTERGF